MTGVGYLTVAATRSEYCSTVSSDGSGMGPGSLAHSGTSGSGGRLLRTAWLELLVAGLGLLESVAVGRAASLVAG